MRFLIVGIMLLIPMVASAGERPITEEEWTDESKVWLARSCVGEAGFHARGECLAIAWVYAERSSYSDKFDFLGMVKRYSAAVQKSKNHRTWIRGLNLAADKPEDWPEGPDWEGVYKPAWQKLLSMVDEWANGEWDNPCPGANHFGGYHDTSRIRRLRWRPVKCMVRTRNRFFDSRRLVSANHAKRWRWTMMIPRRTETHEQGGNSKNKE